MSSRRPGAIRFRSTASSKPNRWRWIQGKQINKNAWDGPKALFLMAAPVVPGVLWPMAAEATGATSSPARANCNWLEHLQGPARWINRSDCHRPSTTNWWHLRQQPQDLIRDWMPKTKSSLVSSPRPRWKTSPPEVSPALASTPKAPWKFIPAATTLATHPDDQW